MNVEIGLGPRNSISGNSCFEFSALVLRNEVTMKNSVFYMYFTNMALVKCCVHPHRVVGLIGQVQIRREIHQSTDAKNAPNTFGIKTLAF
jgi:hypothetical protein